MNSTRVILAAAIALGFAGAVAAETIVITEPQVRTIVTKAGYAEPVLIKREDTLWRVRSTNPAGMEVTLFVDDKGKVLGAADVARSRIVTTTTTTKTVPPAPVDASYVTKVLVDAGFHDIHDVSLDDGVWKAEADDITGDDREIHIDATTGLIAHIEDD